MLKSSYAFNSKKLLKDSLIIFFFDRYGLIANSNIVARAERTQVIWKSYINFYSILTTPFFNT